MKTIFTLASVLLFGTKINAAQTIISGMIGPNTSIRAWCFDSLQRITTLYRGFSDSSGHFSIKFANDEIRIGRIFNYPIYFFPGDSIYVSGNGKYVFKSKMHADGLNFPNLIENKYGLQPTGDYAVCEDPLKFPEFNRDLVKTLTLRQSFLDTFRIHNSLNQDLYEIYTKEIHFRYLLDYFTAITSLKNQITQIPNSSLKTISEIQRLYNKDDMIFSKNYTLGAIYVKDYLTMLVQTDSSDVFKSQFSTVCKYLSGNTLDYLMMLLLKQNKEVESSSFKEAYNYFVARCKNPNYTNYIKGLVKSENAFKNTLSKKDLLTIPILTLENKEVTFKDILESNKGNTILIDCWASWCKPCISEIPGSLSLSTELKKQGIVVLYLSFDNEPDKWKKAAKKYKINTNSYLIHDGFQSSFSKELNIKSIPRYIIVNSSGQIINSDSPRPSDPQLRRLLIDSVSVKQQ